MGLVDFLFGLCGLCCFAYCCEWYYLDFLLVFVLCLLGFLFVCLLFGCFALDGFWFGLVI